MAAKTIPLKSPITPFDGQPPLTSITLKEPTGGQYLDFGEPRLLAKNADGTMFWFEDKAAIRSYLDVIVDHPNGGHILRLLSIPDVRAVREALFGFFSDTPPSPQAGPAAAPSTPSTSDS